MFPSFIASHQTAYIQTRYIREAGRLISDNLNISDKISVDSCLVTDEIEKAFDSPDHEFLLVVLKNLTLVIIPLIRLES